MHHRHRHFRLSALARDLTSAAILAIALFACWPGQLFSQETTVISGTRIRLALKPGGEKLVGNYVGRSQDFVIVRLDRGDTVSQVIALDRLDRIEIDQGRSHPIGARALVGAGIGAVAGGVLGLLVKPPCQGDVEWCFAPATTGQMVASGVVVGAVVGSMAGVVVGAIGHQRWLPVELPRSVRVEVRPGGSVGLRIPLRF